MNINLKLKKRRERIQNFIKHEKTKTLRKFHQAQRELDEQGDNPDEAIKNKIEKYKNIEQLIQAYDNQISHDRTGMQEVKSETTKDNSKIKQKNIRNMKDDETSANIQTNKQQFILQKSQKKSGEEIAKEKEEKKLKRIKEFRKLKKKTPKGQPIMKFQIEHLLHKIKSKKNKGII